MKEETATVVSVHSVAKRARAGDGIEVEEGQLGIVTAQPLFKMRCECGRSWFELELPKVIRCPACRTLGLVTT